jgi:poly-gamma-glutamate capsule biosynthesis protein CapA/YwtB (metallophosphatase superfamily)
VPYEEESGDIDLAFVGDALVSRRLNVHREPQFLAISDILHNADLAMANAETLFHEFEGIPVAESGLYGTYVACDPAVIDDLKALGIGVMSTANNHCVDYGETGLLANMDNLKAHGMPYAGTGRSLTEAVSPVYVDTAKGSVAFLAVTLTMPPAEHRAGEPRGVMKARPGANVLRHGASHVVPPDTFDALVEVGRNLRLGRPFRAGEQQIRLMGQQFTKGTEYETHETISAADLDLNLAWVRDARRLADWVVVSMHNHESGATRDLPADFTREFAKRAIDAGADVVYGHGPHLDRGIEIYNGKPIIYSLGNFILHNDLIKHQPWDLAKRFDLPPGATTADIYDTRSRTMTGGIAEDPQNFLSSIATVRFRGWELAEIELVPLDLGVKSPRRSQRGRPLIAEGQVATDVLERLRALSATYGTDITVKDDRATVTGPFPSAAISTEQDGSDG